MNLSSLISNLLIPAKNEAMYTTYRTVSIVLIICMGVAAIQSKNASTQDFLFLGA